MNFKGQIYITCSLLVSVSVVVVADGTGDQGSLVRGGDTTVAGDGAGARHGSIVAAVIKVVIKFESSQITYKYYDENCLDKK